MSIKLGSNPPAMAPELLQVRDAPPSGRPSGVSPGPIPVPSRDGFDIAKNARPPTLDDQKNKLLASPEFKKMSPGAQSALEKALPYVKDLKGLDALRGELNSKWFQGLKPAEQEKTMKSLLNEVLSPLDKIEMRQHEIMNNLR